MSYFYTNIYQRSDKIYIRGYGNGKRFADDVDYQPYLFVPGDGKYQTLAGQACVKKQFDSIRQARDYIKQFEDVEGANFYGLTNFQYVALNDEFPGAIDYDPSLISVVSIDIEVHSPNEFPDIDKADKMISAITLFKKDKAVTLGMKAYTPTDSNINYVLCKDEKDLLRKFLIVWNDEGWSPDVVTGWNIEMFDIPYLVNRIGNLLGRKAVNSLSPWGFVYPREIIRGKYANSNFEDRKEIVYDIAGITQLDYQQLYRKFTFTNHESYALGHIAHVELGEKKVDFGEARSLAELYEKDPSRYYEYNIHDARLPLKLDEKLGFIPLVFALAYKAKINYVDALTTLRPWDVIIHNHLLAKNIVIPQPDQKNFRAFEGAYVKDVQIGMHRWVVSFDLTSLYPSLISQCNISPETFVKKIDINSIDDILAHKILHSKDEDISLNNTVFSITAGGCLYHKDKQGFLGELVDTFIADRAKIKKEMKVLEKKQDPALANEILKLHNYQWALKILTNGLYGALGNRYFRWFDVDLAESITKTGQLAVRWIMGAINDYLNKTLSTTDVDYVIAGDTDSVYLNLEPLVKKCGISGDDTKRIVAFLDKVCKEKLEPFIERQFMALSKMLGSYNHKLIMNREAICNKAIWRGKKMYILNVWNNEGIAYDKPKLKMKGIEAVRSSTPMICRSAIREALSVIMNKEEPDLQKYVADFEAKFMELPFEDIASPSSLNGLDSYYDPHTLFKLHCPIHVRGSILYNKLLNDKKLTNKYQTIHNKDKIKFVYLKKPNPINDHVISAYDELPKEFGLDQYIDRDTQFEKKFLSPIRSITDIIGWQTEKQSNLLAHFA